MKAHPIGLLALALASAAPAGVVFTDTTARCGVNTIFQAYAPGVPFFNEWMMGGACIIDANLDGWPDTFVLKGGTGTDLLYINNGDGTFTNAAPAWGLAATHCGNGVACGDFNHDGLPDLYVTSYGF